MAQINVFSPAKINLFLAITGKRADGFHDLVSLVVPLSFGDEIQLSIVEGERQVSLACDVEGIPTDSNNLASKAALLYLDRFSISASVHIDLKKKIPSGAGLGGGSSNAAVVLKALNQHFDACSDVELSDLSAEIGSDCPLFLLGEAVIMRGRGEKIERLTEAQRERLSGLEILLYKPSLSISTPWAYRQLAKTADNYLAADRAEAVLRAFWDSEISYKELMFNSFEKPVYEKLLGLSEMQGNLSGSFDVPVLMSGSGSCCFALCPGEKMDAIRDLVITCWGHRVFVEETTTLL